MSSIAKHFQPQHFKPQHFKPLCQRVVPVWQRLRAALFVSVAVGLSGCVVLPADTVIYDDAAVERNSGSSPDVVIIDRGPVYVPAPGFWHDSHWGHRHRYRRGYRHGYRDGRKPRGRGGARWEGRPGRGGVDRGARQRDGEFRGRVRSGASPRSGPPKIITK